MEHQSLTDDAPPESPRRLPYGVRLGVFSYERMKLTKKDIRKVFNLYANGSSITQLQRAHNTTRQKIIDMLQLAGIDNPMESINGGEEDSSFDPFPDTLLPSYTEKQLEAMSPDMLRATLSAYANEMGRRVMKSEQHNRDLFLENRRIKDAFVKHVRRKSIKRKTR